MKEMEKELNRLLTQAMRFAEEHSQGFCLCPDEGPHEQYFNGHAAKEYGWDSSSAQC